MDRTLEKQPPSWAASVRFEDVAICPPVYQELLQGIDGTEMRRFQEDLLSLPMVETPVRLRCFAEAAAIYRQGRRMGVTIRSSEDCLVAVIAMEHIIELWHKDRDFDKIAQFTLLRQRNLATLGQP